MHRSFGEGSASVGITKQAVGRHSIIGSLYDIRNERFEGGNLFNQQVPPSLVVTTDCACTDYFVDDNRSQNDTFKKLNIEASMKLSLMAGLVQAEGSAKYLNQTKTDSRTVRVTFMFNAKTKQEDLQISMAELHNYFSPDALENQHATHCVIGITYGAHVAATFEQTLTTIKQAEELQGRLSAQLKKVTMNVSGDARKRMINDFLAKIEPWEAWLPSEWTTIIHDKTAELAGQELQTQRQLATLLEQIRCGEADEKEMVFAICAGDSSEKVSSEELIKFLELVAELEGGEDAIDSHAAKLIVEKIMKSSDEERDDKNITEKEFLSW
ncbi:unnamed protein product [Rotaria sordida]|uniref:SNTX MACPF/CDC-like domain-containing protein n=2 Tax=Rotaria sordida TaxID=392033 RepID=A0A819PC88_9BILA|nr:unnamed protein product [Rotaria sordida]